MADNVDDPGTGATFATWEHDAAHTQRVIGDRMFMGFVASMVGIADVDGYAAGEQIGEQFVLENVPRGTYLLHYLTMFPQGAVQPVANMTVVIAPTTPDSPPAWATGDGAAWAPTDGRTLSLLFAPLTIETPFGAGSVTVARADLGARAPVFSVAAADATGADVPEDTPALAFSLVASGVVATLAGDGFVLTGVLERVGPLPAGL